MSLKNTVFTTVSPVISERNVRFNLQREDSRCLRNVYLSQTTRCLNLHDRYLDLQMISAYLETRNCDRTLMITGWKNWRNLRK